MIGFFIVKRSSSTLFGCNIGEIEENISVMLLTKADYFHFGVSSVMKRSLQVSSS